MDQKKRTEIASLGQFGLIDLLTSGFTPKNASTLKGAGDDAAVIAPGRGEAVLCTTDSFYEGVDFDLTYFPLKHLGYKAVTAGVSDILAMNALPAQITVPLSMQEQIMRLGLVDVIGHITPASTGCYLVTPDGQDIKLKAQGFPEE